MPQGETLTTHNNDGPWGNSPWKPKPPSSTSGNELDDLLLKGQQHFKKILGGPTGSNSNSKVLFIILLGSLVLWLLSGFYTVDPEEEAVVLRFGQYNRIADSGLNYHLPTPFEHIIIEKVTRIEREEIGFRSTATYSMTSNQNASSQRNIPEESLMLTGDENIVDINFEVQWKISNLKDYLFNINKPKDTVKSTAESAMREVIGNTPIAAALAEGRSSIEQQTKTLLQSTLDSYGAGVEIVRLQMLKVDPPAEVVDAFRDVQTARADKEREINQAQTYQNDLIPRARGNAARIVQESEGAKQEVIARAKGEASRFLAVYEQYALAKEVTRKRLYLETMEEVLQGMDKIIIDSATGTQGILPYLPLPTLNKKPQ